MSEELDDLFESGLDNKMDFLKEKSNVSNDGIYRVDLSKVKEKGKGYRSVIRFLPNITKEGKLGQSAIEKIAHYVKLQNSSELSGYYDSPKNFDEPCPLTKLYYSLKDSKNAILAEKAEALNYSRKYYSYIEVLEDEQQPELVGKVMVFQYGKTIKDKILAEDNGEITGESCNVFDLSKGKDFVMVVKEIETGDRKYPDYKMSMFRPHASAVKIYSEKKGEFKEVPLNEDGKIEPSVRGKVKEYIMSRDHELEEFAPKPLTEEQQGKINEITNLLTGKSSGGFNKSSGGSSAPSESDFGIEGDLSTDTSSNEEEDEDDFFDDL